MSEKLKGGNRETGRRYKGMLVDDYDHAVSGQLVLALEGDQGRVVAQTGRRSAPNLTNR